MMSAGHIAMAFDASFLLALLLLIVGCGLLKGNISTQVGGLYAADDDHAGRTRGFSIFSTAINIGAVHRAPAVRLARAVYGWHAGFGLAGMLMLVGLATYMAGYRYLPEPSRRPPCGAPPMLTRGDWSVIAALFVVIADLYFPVDRVLSGTRISALSG